MSVLRPETALRQILIETPEAFEKLGDRITRGAAQQTSAYPFGMFARTKTAPHYNMGGNSTLREVDVMFAWYDTDFDALDLLVELIEETLGNFAGTVEVGGRALVIDTTYLTDERDGDVLTADGSGEPLYCIEQIFRVAFNPAT